MNKKIFVFLILFIVSFITYYCYFTSKNTMKDIVTMENVDSAIVNTNFYLKSTTIPVRIALGDNNLNELASNGYILRGKSGISELESILNSYSYKRTFKLSNLIPTNSNFQTNYTGSWIYIYIVYLNQNNEYEDIHLTFYSNNKVGIVKRRPHTIEYRAYSKNEKIFKELNDWLKLMVEI